MKKFRIEMTETISYVVDVYANSEDEARDKVYDVGDKNIRDSDTIIESVFELDFEIDYEFLDDYAEKIDSAFEGTCFLYKYEDKYYNVLIDDTVEETSLAEWEEFKSGGLEND